MYRYIKNTHSTASYSRVSLHPSGPTVLVPLCGLRASLLQDGATALLCAAEQGHLEAVHTLLVAGANPAAASSKVKEMGELGA